MVSHWLVKSSPSFLHMHMSYSTEIPYLPTYSTVILTTSASNVSASRSTISPVSSKLGMDISLTVWPSGPSMLAVSKEGWLPAKKMCGQVLIMKGSASWNG